jgi:glycosyltransferase involved in cell wall biosynthesis
MLSAGQRASTSPADRPGRRTETVGYYLGVFPCLSETFIQREVDALYRAGLGLRVFAHESLDADLLQPMGQELARKTLYLPLEAKFTGKLLGRCWRHPVRTLRMLCHFWTRWRVIFHPQQSKRVQLARVLSLAAAAEREGVTHLHSPWAFADASVTLLAARLLGVPYSVQPRASDLHARTQRRGLPERLAEANFLVTNSDYNVRAIELLLPADQRPPIRRVYEGLDVQALRPVPPREGPLGVARLLCVARLTEPKGITDLLLSLDQLRREGRLFTCDIIGATADDEPDYCAQVRGMHRDLGLEAHVRFLGARSFDTVLDRLRWADLFLLPARKASDGRRDITPNSLIEALAMGVPAVSTHSGAIAEIIESEQSGLLVPPNDPTAFTAAIKRLLDEDAFRCRLAGYGRRVAEERFDIDRNIQTYLRLFQRSGSSGLGASNPFPGRPLELSGGAVDRRKKQTLGVEQGR